MTDEIKSEDELATEQAASGAPGTAGAPETGPEPTDEPVRQGNPAQDAEFKGWIRANIHWILAELDHIKEGRTAEEREVLNP